MNAKVAIAVMFACLCNVTQASAANTNYPVPPFPIPTELEIQQLAQIFQNHENGIAIGYREAFRYNRFNDACNKVRKKEEYNDHDWIFLRACYRVRNYDLELWRW